MRDCSGAFFVGLSTYAGVNEEMMFCVKLALCRVMGNVGSARLPTPCLAMLSRLSRSLPACPSTCCPHLPGCRYGRVCCFRRVARDLGGSKFWWTYPYVHDESTQRAAVKGMGSHQHR